MRRACSFYAPHEKNFDPPPAGFFGHQAGRNDPRVVEHNERPRAKKGRNVTKTGVSARSSGNIHNQEPGRITRFGRPRRNAIWRQFIVKILDSQVQFLRGTAECLAFNQNQAPRGGAKMGLPSTSTFAVGRSSSPGTMPRSPTLEFSVLHGARRSRERQPR